MSEPQVERDIPDDERLEVDVIEAYESVAEEYREALDRLRSEDGARDE